jgi:uncharacterized protein (DUF488 family)
MKAVRRGNSVTKSLAKPPPEAPSAMPNPFFTIGHSTRPLDAFAGLLEQAGVLCVVDVRTMPRSRSNPQYNSDVLAAALAELRIDYEHIAALGGLRPRQPDVPPAANAFWENRSFHNYADYAMGEGFHTGLRRLRERGHGKRCVIMCAETLWWRCHRRIIADYLIAAGEAVFHILGPGQIALAWMTPAARLGLGGKLTYPADVSDPVSAAKRRRRV